MKIHKQMPKNAICIADTLSTGIHVQKLLYDRKTFPNIDNYKHILSTDDIHRTFQIRLKNAAQKSHQKNTRKV